MVCWQHCLPCPRGCFNGSMLPRQYLRQAALFSHSELVFQACFCCPAGPFLHSGRDIGEQDVLLSLQLPKSFASSLGCQQYGCQNTRAYGAVAGHGNIVVLIGNAGVLSRLPITCTFSQSNLTRPDSQSSERLELLTPFA